MSVPLFVAFLYFNSLDAKHKVDREKLNISLVDKMIHLYSIVATTSSPIAQGREVRANKRDINLLSFLRQCLIIAIPF